MSTVTEKINKFLKINEILHNRMKGKIDTQLYQLMQMTKLNTTS